VEAGRERSCRNDGEEEEEDEVKGEDVIDEDESDVEDANMEDVDNETNTNPNNHQDKLKPLTRIQKACLDFCIELLNQTVTQREYDSTLVCALAMLGVNEDGWKGPD